MGFSCETTYFRLIHHYPTGTSFPFAAVLRTIPLVTNHLLRPFPIRRIWGNAVVLRKCPDSERSRGHHVTLPSADRSITSLERERFRPTTSTRDRVLKPFKLWSIVSTISWLSLLSHLFQTTSLPTLFSLSTMPSSRPETRKKSRNYGELRDNWDFGSEYHLRP